MLHCTERLCREPHEIPGRVKVTNELGEPISSLRFRRSVSDTSEMEGRETSDRAAAALSSSQSSSIPQSPRSRLQKMASVSSKTDPSLALSDKQGTGQAVGRLTTNTRRSNLKKSLTTALSTTPQNKLSFSESFDYLKLSITSSNHSHSVDYPDSHSDSEAFQEVGGAHPGQAEFETLREPSPAPTTPPNEEKLTAGVADEGSGHLGYFRPLLLFIPLRLGQDNFNMEYADALKVSYSIHVDIRDYVT